MNNKLPRWSHEYSVGEIVGNFKMTIEEKIEARKCALEFAVKNKFCTKEYAELELKKFIDSIT